MRREGQGRGSRGGVGGEREQRGGERKQWGGEREQWGGETEQWGGGGCKEGRHLGSWKHGYLKTYPQETLHFEDLL